MLGKMMVQAKKTLIQCNASTLFISLFLIFLLPLSLFFLINSPNTSHRDPSPPSFPTPQTTINVFITDLPRSFNYDLLSQYWSYTSDSRLGSDVDNDIRRSILPHLSSTSNLPYPENPLIKQYSAEYWILGDLLTPQEFKRGSSFAQRVFDYREADVVFVPFFATLSAEMQLGVGKGVFRKKVDENEDYVRQKKVVDFVRASPAWNRSGGRDHVFVLTGYVKS